MKTELSERVERLEQECRHFQRQFQLLIEHVSRSDEMLQNIEYRLFKLESGNELRH